MGNRVHYIIGATIASVAITLMMVAIMPAVTQTPTTSTALNALGHVQLTVYNPEGDIIAYRQSDNFVMNKAVNKISALLFSGAGVLPTEFKFLTLCSGNSVAGGSATEHDDATCEGEMQSDREDGSSATHTDAAGAGGSSSSDTIEVTLTILAADDKTSFNELALFNAVNTGSMFSVATFTEIFAVTDMKIAAKYVIEIAGG